jgi:very-short-patch-repair endonuclease
MDKRTADKRTVLVAVLKDRRDLGILLREHWYRMPVMYAPVRRFRYLAFYQPACKRLSARLPTTGAVGQVAMAGRPASFGRDGKCIRYYAPVLGRHIRRRRDLLPDEPVHPRAGDDYVRVRVGRIRELPEPIRNTTPRRVTFGFTTLKRLLTSKNILELYGVPPTERLVGDALRREGIRATPQLTVSIGRKRYRLDFAVSCKQGMLAVECDNLKAHAGSCERRKDKLKDAALKRHRWTVLRLREREILSDTASCIGRVRRAVRRLGGIASAGY